MLTTPLQAKQKDDTSLNSPFNKINTDFLVIIAHMEKTSNLAATCYDSNRRFFSPTCFSPSQDLTAPHSGGVGSLPHE